MSHLAKTVFIVDDEPLLIEMLTDYLREHFPALTVRAFHTGEACIKGLGERPHLVILDYHLNSKEKEAANGMDILKEIKKIDPLLPIIILSNQTSYGTAAKTIAHGAIHYVAKGKAAFDEIRGLVQANL